PAIQWKPAARDPVAVSADDVAEIRVRFEIPGKVVEAEHDIAHPSFAIGYAKRGHDASEVHDPNLEPGGVLQGEEFRGGRAHKAAPRRMLPNAADPGDEPEKTSGR